LHKSKAETLVEMMQSKQAIIDESTKSREGQHNKTAWIVTVQIL